VQFEVIIRPSKKNLKAHTDSIRAVLKKGSNKPQFDVIKELNPIITGWCNYHCTSPGIRHTFEKVGWITWQMLRGWARRRVGKSGDLKQYWRKVSYLEGKTGKQRIHVRFSTPAGFILKPHTDTQTVTYVKVKDNVSPFNGDWAYWSKRRGEYPGTPNRVAKLLKTQKGKCWHCGLYIESDDELEVHHIDKHRRNNAYSNLALVHLVCHDRLHGKGEVVSDDNG
jgi:RNA-directed DNA polymerase